MVGDFRPDSRNSTNIPPGKSSPLNIPTGKSKGGNGTGWKGAIGDTGSFWLQNCKRPWMWVIFPAGSVLALGLIANAANLGFKLFTGEQNALPVTSDGISTGAISGVRSLFGATREQVIQGAGGENVYNRPLAQPSPEAAKEPLQPNVQ
jgi:hypothetical protein